MRGTLSASVYHVETLELTDVDIGAHTPETERYATGSSVNACVALLEYVCSSNQGPTPTSMVTWNGWGGEKGISGCSGSG